MKQAPNRPRRGAAGFSASRIFNTDSPITKYSADIQTFLSVCILNWSLYDENEKKEIISKLPSTYRSISYDVNGVIECPISPGFLAHDKVIRDQIARFRRDVSDGYYTRTWQEKARRAMTEREDGKFDEYIASHTAEIFDDILGDDEGEDGEEGCKSDGEYGPKKKARRNKVDERDKRKLSRVMAALQDVENTEEMDRSAK